MSAVDLCAEALDRAAAAPEIFWSVDREGAFAQAASVDRRIGAGEDAGLLAGVPVAVKDSFDLAGLPTTGGLPRPLHTAVEDAAAVAALRRAGAVPIGKTAMDQLAWSMSGEAPGHPPCENPAAPGRLAGGSSGGSAAAVAAGIVSLALGTDTAGSTRVPASWCGVVGLQLTRGAGDLDGCLPLAPSGDSLGVLAGSVGECRRGLAALTGSPPPAAPSERPLRLGVLTATFDRLAGGELESVYALALASLRSAGAELEPLPGEISAPGFGTVLAHEFAAAWADRLEDQEVSAPIADGISHGQRIDAAKLAAARGSVADAEREARQLLDGLDALLLPTAPVAAPPLGQPLGVGEVSPFTRPFSAFGWPAVSVPGGSAGDLPVGLQLAALPNRDAELLERAAWVETALGSSAGGRSR